MTWSEFALRAENTVVHPKIRLDLREHKSGLIVDASLPYHAWHVNVGGLGENFKQTGRHGVDGPFFARSASFVPAGNALTWRVGYRLKRLIIMLDPNSHNFRQKSMLDESTPQDGLFESPPRYDPAIEHYVGLLNQEWDDDLSHRIDFLDAFASMLVLHTKKAYQAKLGISTHHSPFLARLCEYVDQHLAENLSIERITQELAISSQQLSIALRRELQVTPYQFVINRRLLSAKRMLTRSNVSLGDIALACGFSSQSHFTTAFGKSFGMTPKRFRDMHL